MSRWQMTQEEHIIVHEQEGNLLFVFAKGGCTGMEWPVKLTYKGSTYTFNMQEPLTRDYWDYSGMASYVKEQ